MLILRAYDTELAPPRRSPTGEGSLPCDWLFAVAGEALLVVDAATLQIVRANPAAAALLRTPAHALVGAPLMRSFEAFGHRAVRGSIDLTRASGQPHIALLRAAADGAELSAKVSFFRDGPDAYLLIRVMLPGRERPLGPAGSPVFEAIEGAAAGFLMTDAGLHVEYANQSFIDMAELPCLARIQGRSVARWLEFSASATARLRDQMLECQATTQMTAHLRSERNLRREVEVCAVAVPDGPFTCWGFTVRELPRLN